MLKDFEGTASVYSERVAGGRYIKVDINREKAARYSLNISDVQQVVSTAIGGTMPYSYSWSNGISIALNNTLTATSNTVTVTDANGCTDTRTRTNYVQVIGPNVNFGADTLVGCDSLLVNFTDSTIFGAPITSWTWDFGDGDTSSFQSPSHVYTVPGNFTVTLVTSDANGCRSTYQAANYIRVNPTPSADFIADNALAVMQILKRKTKRCVI